MEEEILFSETRQYRRWWTLLLVALLNIPLLGLMWTHISRHDIGCPRYEMWMIAVALILFLVSLLLIYIRADTVVTKDGVFVRMMPFNITFKHYDRQAIKSVSVIKCGGAEECGCDDSGRKQGAAGRFRMKIEMASGEIIYADTFKPEELRAALKEAALPMVK